MAAARLVLDRVCPPRKGRPVTLALSAIEGAADVAAALAGVTQAISDGEIAPEEASVIVTVIEAKRRAIGGTKYVCAVGARVRVRVYTVEK